MTRRDAIHRFLFRARAIGTRHPCLMNTHHLAALVSLGEFHPSPVAPTRLVSGYRDKQRMMHSMRKLEGAKLAVSDIVGDRNKYEVRMYRLTPEGLEVHNAMFG